MIVSVPFFRTCACTAALNLFAATIAMAVPTSTSSMPTQSSSPSPSPSPSHSRKLTLLEGKPDRLRARVSYTEKHKDRSNYKHLEPNLQFRARRKYGGQVASLNQKSSMTNVVLALEAAARYDRLGKYDQAIEAAENVLSVEASKNLPRDPKSTMFRSLSILSTAYEHRGNMNKAEHYCEFMKNYLQTCAPDSVVMASVLERYAHFLNLRGVTSFAHELMARAAEIRKRTGSTRNRVAAVSSANAAIVLHP